MKPFTSRWASGLMLAIFFMTLVASQAQTTIVSSVPVNGATGVLPSAPVVITFSAPMNPDTNVTVIEFVDVTNFSTPKTMQVWSAGNTVVTCTPTPPFTAGDSIEWFVQGQDAQGGSLGGLPFGTFTVAGGSGPPGNGSTNEYTTFGVGDAAYYLQYLNAAPTASTNLGPYSFVADVTLSSNQTANTVHVTLPNSAVSNLYSYVSYQYQLSVSETNQADLTSAFGNGNYVFSVINDSSNEQVTVNLPASLTQPPAPQISNFTAAQAVDPTKPFTLTWNAFAGGTAADFITVDVGGVFQTGTIGDTNALKGTATSVVIPANALSAGEAYTASIGFFHFTGTTNKTAKYIKAAYRYSATEFPLVTSGGVVVPPGPVSIAKVALNGGTFSFNVISDIGEVVTIQYSTSVAGPWNTLSVQTNTIGTITVSALAHIGNAQMFYRAHSD